MNVRELIFKDDPEQKPVFYSCGNCGLCYGPSQPPFDKKPKEKAEICCNNKCKECGEPVKIYHTLCFECRKKEWERKEKERFEKSEKIELEDYHCEIFFIGDTCFWDEQEAFDFATEDQEILPDYIYAQCGKKIRFQLNFETIIEDAEERYLENCEDDIDIDYIDINQLREFINQWNQKQKYHIYKPNSVYVRIPNPYEES